MVSSSARRQAAPCAASFFEQRQARTSSAPPPARPACTCLPCITAKHLPACAPLPSPPPPRRTPYPRAPIFPIPLAHPPTHSAPSARLASLSCARAWARARAPRRARWAARACPLRTCPPTARAMAAWTCAGRCRCRARRWTGGCRQEAARPGQGAREARAASGGGGGGWLVRVAGCKGEGLQLAGCARGRRAGVPAQPQPQPQGSPSAPSLPSRPPPPGPLCDRPPSLPRPRQVVDAVPITQGNQHQYCVGALGGPLRITLVWWVHVPVQCSAALRGAAHCPCDARLPVGMHCRCRGLPVSRPSMLSVQYSAVRRHRGCGGCSCCYCAQATCTC